MAASKTTAKSRFCSACGTRLNPDARFCHSCGAPAGGSPTAAPEATRTSKALTWGIPIFAFVALIVLSIVQFSSTAPSASTGTAQPLGNPGMSAPDISGMSPEERADRLFNQVMRLASEGKTDSVAFFAPMALITLESVTPLDAHRRYDLGLVALVSGDAGRAKAQADTILSSRRTHLLGLSLAARAADALGNSQAASAFRRSLIAAETAETAAALPEYRDHAADIRSSIDSARIR